MGFQPRAHSNFDGHKMGHAPPVILPKIEKSSLSSTPSRQVDMRRFD